MELIVLPLHLIFEDCIANCIFLDPWKWANLIPVHKDQETM